MDLRHLIVLIGAVVLVGLLPQAADAQHSMYARALDRFDANKDGKVQRSEIPEGIYRNMYDRMVEQFKLDPEKTYDRKELEKVLAGTSSPSSSGSTSPAPGDRRNGRTYGSRPGSNGSRLTDSKPYRSIVELPMEYRLWDKDGDGQIGLYEWPRARIAEFVKLDVNDDGFLTMKELKQSKEDSKSEKKAPEEKAPMTNVE